MGSMEPFIALRCKGVGVAAAAEEAPAGCGLLAGGGAELR